MNKFFVLLGIPFLVLSQEPNSLVKIETALRNSQITTSEAMRLKSQWIEGRTLPSEYSSPTHVKCGTAVIHDLNKSNQFAPKTFYQKTDREYNHTFLSKGDTITFRFMYDTSGSDRISSKDLDQNGIPDYLDEAIKSAEYSYRLEVDTLGYKQPRSFVQTGYMPIRILNLSTLYGFIDPDLVPVTIFIDNDYQDFPTAGYEGLKVTIAHEFHHTIQIEYNSNFSDEDRWYYEVTSTWMEDVAYDDINDYYFYLSAYFNNPQHQLTVWDLSSEYAECIFNHFLEKEYGRSIVRKIWESMANQNVLSAVNQTIRDNSSDDARDAFRKFLVWNYFTKNRAVPADYYPEGAFYPRIRFSSNQFLSDTTVSQQLYPMSSNYFNFYSKSYDNYDLNFSTPGNPSLFDVMVIQYNATTGKRDIQTHHAPGAIKVSNINGQDSVVIIVANTNLSSSSSSANRIKYAFEIGAKSSFNSYPSPYFLNSGQDLKWRFRLSSDSKVQVSIYTVSGKLVKHENFGNILFSQGVHDGLTDNNLRWNGRDSDGNLLPSGIYIYKVDGAGIKGLGKIAIVR